MPSPSEERAMLNDLLGDVRSAEADGYWCVVCGRFLESNDGMIVHDDIPHPESMNFNEEENEQ